LRNVILDGEKINNREELHVFLKDALELPDYYGHNLDALWDVLTGGVAMPLTIRWLHYQDSVRKLGEYSEHLLQLFRDVENELEGFRLLLE